MTTLMTKLIAVRVTPELKAAVQARARELLIRESDLVRFALMAISAKQGTGGIAGHIESPPTSPSATQAPCDTRKEEKMTDQALKPGTQILYVPAHAEGDEGHLDVEMGFVTSMHFSGVAVFCRYWSKYSRYELRTTANSELTLLKRIVVRDTVAQERVDRALGLIQLSGYFPSSSMVS